MKRQPKRLYVTYDGRAWDGDTDRATVLFTSDSLQEAIHGREDFSEDAVTYSYDSTGKYLADRRLEIMSGGLEVQG